MYQLGCDCADGCISWGVTVQMDVSADMLIGSCCGFFIDLIISYCFRININFFQEIYKFPCLGKL